jgi:uncharacterized membrane protein
MAELILFAIISAFAGVYTLYPKHRQVRLNFSISSHSRHFGLVGLILVLIAVILSRFASDANSYLKSPEWLAINHLNIGGVYFGISFIADIMQILIVLGISTYLFYILSSTSAPVSDWSSFGSNVREFRDNQNHSQLADLLNDYYSEVFYHNPEVPDNVKGIIEESIMNREFITTCISTRPDFILRVITDSRVDLVDREHLSDIALRYLITEPDSLLYSEIRNLEKLHGYALDRIPERYRILSNIFEDCSIEEDLSMARSIGEPTIDYLRELPDEADDPYNTRSTRFSPSPSDAIPSVYEDQIYIAIQYFDLAVREALHQDHQGHMWLHYYYYFSDEICNNYHQVSQSDGTDEWESDYQYLLWEMIDNTIDWITVAEVHWYNGDFKLTDKRRPVIQSAVDMLFQVHQRILTCDNIQNEFKQKASHKIIDSYFDLKMSHSDDSNRIGEKMRAHIAGVTSGDDPETTEYRRQFSRHLSTADIDYLHYSRADKARQIRDDLEQTIL